MNEENPTGLPANETRTGAAIFPEPCPQGTTVLVPGCQDFAAADLGPTELLSLGRIVQVDVTLKAICPGKRVAVSILLSEVDGQGNAQPRGVKHILVPAQTGEGCRDVTLRCIPFSLPEALDPAGDPYSICGQRTFRAQVIANYVDTDFLCCEGETVQA